MSDDVLDAVELPLNPIPPRRVFKINATVRMLGRASPLPYVPDPDEDTTDG